LSCERFFPHPGTSRFFKPLSLGISFYGTPPLSGFFCPVTLVNMTSFLYRPSPPHRPPFPQGVPALFLISPRRRPPFYSSPVTPTMCSDVNEFHPIPLFPTDLQIGFFWDRVFIDLFFLLRPFFLQSAGFFRLVHPFAYGWVVGASVLLGRTHKPLIPEFSLQRRQLTVACCSFWFDSPFPFLQRFLLPLFWPVNEFLPVSSKDFERFVFWFFDRSS